MAATTMSSLFVTLFALAASSFRARAALQAEILALRHQLAVFQKNAPRRLRPHRLPPALVGCVVRILVRLAAMSRDGSARHGPPLAPPSFRLALDQEIPPPSRKARSCGEHSRSNSAHEPSQPFGARRVHGELLKLGIAVAQSTVARYLRRSRKPPSQNSLPSNSKIDIGQELERFRPRSVTAAVE